MDPLPLPKPRANLRPTSTVTTDTDDDADGPFFDLEFSLPETETEIEIDENGSDSTFQDSDAENDDDDDDPSLFPSQSEEDDLPHSASLLFTPNSKPQLHSLLKPASSKLRIFMLRFKKPPKTAQPLETCPKKQTNNNNFLIKYSVEDVPIFSLFARNNIGSSRSSTESPISTTTTTTACSEKQSSQNQNAKDVIHKYLNKINRASKRYGDKLRFSGQLNVVGDSVSKRLRKSKSASAAVAAVRSPPPRRMDDSLTQHEDGIQSAIAHCKRSFEDGNVSATDSVTTPATACKN